MTITAHKQKEGSWGRKEGWGMGWNFILSQVFLLGKERLRKSPWSSENQTIPDFRLDTVEAKGHIPLQDSVGPRTSHL